ncbi:microsomal glutathione S-transferase 1-like [Athalia rosae]|uniref:microsomal glutathione S-transferase 1-like n=1 Tax=Athalia rosae TaxID=37344 RepID=UPI00203388CA|nr:microsomal glutathione S-transferase 1-like [Athalia rosae]
MSLNIDPESLRVFGFWGAILVLKVLALAPLTARQRLQKQIFSNPEDVKYGDKKAKLCFDDPDVERVRRCHLNDLENVVPWFLATFLWLSTNPSTWLAGILIRSFVISRIVYTIVYALVPLPQPSRAITFFVGFLITAYMATSTLLHYA